MRQRSCLTLSVFVPGMQNNIHFDHSSRQKLIQDSFFFHMHVKQLPKGYAVFSRQRNCIIIAGSCLCAFQKLSRVEKTDKSQMNRAYVALKL